VFNRLCESGRTYPFPPVAALSLSAAANVAVVIAAAVATQPAPPPLPGETMREVVYLLPLPPRRPPAEEVGLQWKGGHGPGAGPERADSSGAPGAAGGGDKGEGAGRRGDRQRPRPPVKEDAPVGDFDGGTVYIASELDRPVSFDPTSAGPEYPSELRLAGVEGWATLRFVVDSTGSADMKSITEVDVTHPQFAAAVREALPKMHFRPAELGERPVAQLVEQQFKVVIQMAASAAPNDSAPPR
jgi:TonB family protein